MSPICLRRNKCKLNRTFSLHMSPDDWSTQWIVETGNGFALSLCQDSSSRALLKNSGLICVNKPMASVSYWTLEIYKYRIHLPILWSTLFFQRENIVIYFPCRLSVCLYALLHFLSNTRIFFLTFNYLEIFTFTLKSTSKIHITSSTFK